MKKFFLIVVSVFCMSWQIPSMSSINTSYGKLMNKSIGEVMKALQLSPKDTIGKTSPTYIGSVKPENLYLGLTDKVGNLLCFKNNKLSAIVPKK